MPATIRLAILSFAHGHGHHWARALSHFSDAKLIAVWDDNRQRGENAAFQYGAEFVPNLDRLLARKDIDAVGIAAENARHADLTVAAAVAGKHIFCEKPMATTLEDCDRMIEAVERAGVIYMQVFPMRFDLVNHKIKEILDDGILGKVGVVRKRHGHNLAQRWKDRTPQDLWFINPVLAGGGAFLDEGIHAVDWLRWLFGEPISVTAKIGTLQTDLPVDDNGIAIFEFPGNTIATLYSSWTGVAATDTSEIYGDRGTLIQSFTDVSSTRVLGETSRPLRLFTEGTKAWRFFDFPIHFPKNHTTIPRAFVDCLREDKKPPVTAHDGRQALAMVLAAYQSSQEGRTVYFDEYCNEKGG